MTPYFDELQRLLNNYPFVKFCFEKYINWVFSQANPNCIREFPLVDMMLNKSHNFQKTQELEDKLIRSKQILKLRERGFRNKFGFQDDLLTNDKEKTHNILAEPLFVLDLDNHKFTNIEKLPRGLKMNGKMIKLADFKAEYNTQSFAIEVKTTMTESGIKDGDFLATKDEAKEMLLNNCLIKIKESNEKIFDQLRNTCNLFHCTKRMIAFYNRRLCIAHHLQKSDFLDVEATILNMYKCKVDYLAMKSYYATETVFFPELGTAQEANVNKDALP